MRVIHLSIEVPKRELSDDTFDALVRALRANRTSGEGLSITLPKGAVFDGVLVRVRAEDDTEVTP